MTDTPVLVEEEDPDEIEAAEYLAELRAPSRASLHTLLMEPV